MTDILLAYLHYLCIFTAFGLLLAELLLLPTARWRLLGRVDIVYFIAAIGILATGLGRVFLGFKPAAYYWHEPWFHALWVTFLLIGLLSIVPTLHFLRWSKAGPDFVPDPKALRHVRGHLQLEILLFAIAPIFAILMARGYGL